MRHIPDLHVDRGECKQLQGIFLVRVEHAIYRWHAQKPFFELRFVVLEPTEHRGHCLTGRLYCTPRALWKLNWFLRDFGYPADLLAKDEVDEKSLLGLIGIIRVSRGFLNSHSFANLDGFAPASQWQDVTTEPTNTHGL